jgi:hypothetical protein
MPHVRLLLLLAVLVVTALAMTYVPDEVRAWNWAGFASLAADGPRMPEFSRHGADAWLNSRPLKAEELRGQVVLLEVYTSG